MFNSATRKLSQFTRVAGEAENSPTPNLTQQQTRVPAIWAGRMVGAKPPAVYLISGTLIELLKRERAIRNTSSGVGTPLMS